MRDYLTDKETAKILGKRINTLYKTVDFFDEHDDDEWELLPGEHFEYTTRRGPNRERRFTEEGVEALARYYERNELGILALVIEALTHRRRKRKRMLVSRRITQELIESGGLVETRGELAFVNRPTTIKILQTNGVGLRNSINRLSTSDSLEGQEGLEIEKHFIQTKKDETIWSQKGIASIAVDMKNNSSIGKSRKAWVEAVGDVVEDCFKSEMKRIEGTEERINRAIAKAKRAAQDTCQITGAKKKRGGPKMQLDGHHLFDKASRPDLDDLHENILVVESSIHSEFHSWKGNRSCVPKDFLDFITEVRSDLFDTSNKRSNTRHSKLVANLVTLQRNYEGNHLRYR